MNIVVLSSIVAVCMAVGAMFIRLKAAKKPATLKKIILPPFFYEYGSVDVCFS
ncbi:CcdC protein domain-containing protein [Bacillus pacificus]